MISLTTGTKVPRRARSANSSNVVCFMLPPARGARLRRRLREQAGRGTLAGPDFELPLGLRDEHLGSADRVETCLDRAGHERRLVGFVDEIVNERSIERGDRRDAGRA